MESIGRAVNSAPQLSKRGGGVAFLLSNTAARAGAPIKRENQSSGVIPVKMLERRVFVCLQLGARRGRRGLSLHAPPGYSAFSTDTKRKTLTKKSDQKRSLSAVIRIITPGWRKKTRKWRSFRPMTIQRRCGKPFGDSRGERYDELMPIARA